MYEITKIQAANYWQYVTLSTPMEFEFYKSIIKIMEGGEGHLCIDEEAKNAAEYLADIINYINPPDDGADNKAVCIMRMARAYVKYLRDVHGNDRFMNPGSFFLICTRIAKNVR